MNPTEIQADIDQLRARAQVHAKSHRDACSFVYFEAANMLATLIYGPLTGTRFTQRGQHINSHEEPFVTVSGSSETESVHWAWNLTRWLNNGWVTEENVAANSVNGLILAGEYTALFAIMENRPEEKVGA